MAFTQYYVTEIPKYSEFEIELADKLKTELPDYAEFISAGAKANSGAEAILKVINDCYVANREKWIKQLRAVKDRAAETERQINQLSNPTPGQFPPGPPNGPGGA